MSSFDSLSWVLFLGDKMELKFIYRSDHFSQHGYTQKLEVTIFIRSCDRDDVEFDIQEIWDIKAKFERKLRDFPQEEIIAINELAESYIAMNSQEIYRSFNERLEDRLYLQWKDSNG
jgi:hypothetical protein